MARAGMALLEREEISRGLVEDPNMDWATLGRRLARHPTTIAREVTRHGGRHRYRATPADLTAERSRRRPRVLILIGDHDLRRQVTADLSAGFSPAGIAARSRNNPDRTTVCAETIYQAVYRGDLDLKARDCLRSRRPRRRLRARVTSPKFHRLGDFNQISDRPEVVAERVEAGHWEGDLVIGARNRSAVITLAERVTKFTHIVTLPGGYNADETLAGLVGVFDTIPTDLRRSLAWDRGSEMARWSDLSATFDLDVWFCDAHKPWQRGLNEHTNRQIRWWLPRGLDLGHGIDDHVAAALNVINHQPRRSLDWASPHDRYHALAH